MRKTLYLLVIGFILLNYLFTLSIFATEENLENITEVPKVQVEWILGEVISVEPEKKEIKLKYFDYITEEEKEKIILVNEKTKYENINSLSEIKPQDTLSIEYLINNKGESVATLITKESEGASLGELENNE